MTVDLGGFAPFAPEEAAVLSTLLVKTGDGWTVVAGSLLTVPLECAHHSWGRWADRQPGAYVDPRPGFDLGPNFITDPFPGLRAVRRILSPAEWKRTAEAFQAGGPIEFPFGLATVNVVDASPTVLLPTEANQSAASAVQGAARPVRGAAFRLEHPPVTKSETRWDLQYPPGLKPGPVLGRIAPHRWLLFWPKRLLGIDWLGNADSAPPAFFVIGRLASPAWLMSVRPDSANEHMLVKINWNEKEIDPLSLTLMVRYERDGQVVLARLIKISDLPGDHSTEQVEPRLAEWDQRTLGVRLPRGPRATDWGASLFGPDGVLLDERRVGRRLEGIVYSSWGGQPPKIPPGPTSADQQEAVDLADAVSADSNRAAAKRRISSRGELLYYLRWRLSSRAGDLLILDPFALRRDDTRRLDDLRFLRSLDRPVRVLTRKGLPLSPNEAAEFPKVQARRLAPGMLLHDRVWLVGELGLAVGASLNHIHPKEGGQAGPITTVTELPYADAAAWREISEAWWDACAPETQVDPFGR